MEGLKLIEKYIEDGITIDGNPKKGYTVFTIPTQHFKISSLSELTPERFERAQKEWRELEELQNQIAENSFHHENPDIMEYLRTEYKSENNT